MLRQREQCKEMDSFTLVLPCGVLSTISRQQCGFMLPEEQLPDFCPTFISSHTYDF